MNALNLKIDSEISKIEGSLLIIKNLIAEQRSKSFQTNSTLQPESKIFEIIYDITGTSKTIIKNDQHLYNDLGFDSLEMMTIGSELEKEFKIIINVDEIERLKTINDLVLMVVNKTNQI